MPDRDKTVAVVGAWTRRMRVRPRSCARGCSRLCFLNRNRESARPRMWPTPFSELVCSNSLRSDELASGIGLIKQELRDL